ncbi:MAG: hypothetical protein NZ741_03595 [Armatimonadetes bacterium]|nr:hypothetical protein [Armatimonadota bacterium]
MELFFLLAQAMLLALAGLMVLRVRQDLQLLAREAQARYAELQPLQEQLQRTLREVRVTLDEGVAQLEERLSRAEQVLRALEVHGSTAPSPPAPESDSKPEREPARLPVERILSLAESGCNATEIARATGVAEGEVALVLQLRASRVQASPQEDETTSLGGGTNV